MTGRLASLFAVLALALTGLAPVSASADEMAHAWCGQGGPTAEEQVLLAELAADLGVAPEPEQTRHDTLCAMCCSALTAPAALPAGPGPGAPFLHARPAGAWPQIHQPEAVTAPDAAPDPARGPPLI